MTAASIGRQRRALGDGAKHFVSGDAKGPSVQRRQLMTAAYSRERRRIKVGANTVTQEAQGCLGSAERNNDYARRPCQSLLR